MGLFDDAAKNDLFVDLQNCACMVHTNGKRECSAIVTVGPDAIGGTRTRELPCDDPIVQRARRVLAGRSDAARPKKKGPPGMPANYIKDRKTDAAQPMQITKQKEGKK